MFSVFRRNKGSHIPKAMKVFKGVSTSISALPLRSL